MLSKTQEKIDKFFSQFELVKFDKGDIVIYPDDTSPQVFFLRKGYVRMYALSTEGVEVTLHVFAPNSYFPMMWALSDIPNRYYYEALTEVEAYSIPKDKALQFLKKQPDALMDLTRRLLAGLDRLLGRVEYLVFGKAHTRVVSTLLFLARHFGKEKDSGVIIQPNFTHREMAAFAGVTRETVSREMDNLKKKKLISNYRRFIIIKNLRRLSRELLLPEE